MSRIQTSGELNSDGGGSPVTWNAPSNFTVGNTVIVVFVYWPSDSVAISGVSIAGTAAVKDHENADDGLNHIHVWRAVVANASRSDVVISFPSGSPYLTGSIDEWDNILTTSPIDATSKAQQTSTATPAISITTVATNTVVYAGYVDCIGQTDITSIATPSGWTLSFNEPNGSAHEGGGAVNKSVATPGAQTATWTMSGANLNSGQFLAISYKTTTSGGGTTEVTKDTTLQWNILKLIQKDSDLRWSILKAISKDSDLRWSILSQISKDTELRWGLLSTVFKDSSLQWDVRKLIQKDSTLQWNVLSSIFKDSTFQWNLLKAIQKDSNLQWNVLSSVVKDADLRWNVLGLVAHDTNLQWSILQLIAKDIQIRWDVNTDSSTVVKDTELRWNIIAAVTKDLILQWDILSNIVKDSELRWTILSAVAKDLSLNWNVLQAIQNDCTLQWSLIGRTQKDLTLLWSIESDTSFPDLSGEITVSFGGPVFSVVESNSKFTI